MSSPLRPNGVRNIARGPTVNIPYSIAGCSGYSGKYLPEHIKTNRPHDLTSRWSAKKDPITGEQWLMLEMKSVGVLETIVFGKLNRPHPCNMKDFKILVGMTPDNLNEVVTSSLRNDHRAETIPIPHLTRHGVVFPTRFVKIMSISAHGQNFNTSIWNVSLYGLIDETRTREIAGNFTKRREDVAMRQILKHLRERRHISTYQQLTAHSGVRLEHPLVSELYEKLVLLGDWSNTERIIHSLAAADLFSSYIQSCKPQAHWRRIHAVDENGDYPSARGGHAMCMDTENGLIYLLGGFDGSRSLDDFWVYSIYTQRWRVISHNVGAEKNGPGPRSCHKMIFDDKTGSIYVLGRLSDNDVPPGQDDTGISESSPGPPTGDTRSRRSVGVNTVNQSSNSSPSSDPNDEFFSEFYRYRTRGIDQGKWELLTAAGPKLLFDHQLVIDSGAQMIYVQGGKVIGDNKENGDYGGLYSYDIRKGKWTMLSQINETANTRFGHSMVLDPFNQKLLIFGGQYEGHFLSDMWEFDLYRKTFVEVTSSFTFRGGPEACFALRSVIDPVLREVYVFEGQTKDKVGSSAESAVWLYRYDSKPGNWTKVVSQPRVKRSQSTPGKRSRSDDEHEEEEVPKARVAHQVVYDPITQTFYLHGGNAGSSRGSQRPSGEGESSVKADNDIRLDDLWSMQLERPPPAEIIRLAKFEVRKQQFRELCEETTDPLKALHFLQNDIFEVVNHANVGEADAFRSLLSHLLAPQPFTSLGEGDSAQLLDEDADMIDLAAEVDDMRHPLKHLTSTDLTSVDDQYELELRNGQSLSEERFKQRSAVFRKLLSFVNPSEREPDGSLLDMIPSSEL